MTVTYKIGGPLELTLDTESGVFWLQGKLGQKAAAPPPAAQPAPAQIAPGTPHVSAPPPAPPAVHPSAQNARSPQPMQMQQPAPQPGPGIDWRSTVLHFGKNKGFRLDQLQENSLGWYLHNYDPNPEMARQDDYDLRAALDACLVEKGLERKPWEDDKPAAAPQPAAAAPSAYPDPGHPNPQPPGPTDPEDDIPF